MNAEIVTIYLHNPIENMEGVLTDFNKEMIKALHENGCIFIGVKRSGERVIIPWDEVEEPCPEAEILKIPIITHQVFTLVMEPIVEAIAELESSQVKSPIATLSAQKTSNTSKVQAAYQQALDMFKQDFPNGYGDM